MTHTPTPWHIHRKANHGPNGLPWIGGHMGRPIAFITHETVLKEDRDRAEANAALIVEAVNSYASLRAKLEIAEKALAEARSMLDSCGLSEPDDEYQAIWDRGLARIDAALTAIREGRE